MTAKIFRSIFLATVGVLLACLVLILGVLYSYFTGAQEQQLQTMLTLTAAGVENSGNAYVQQLDEDCRVTWISADGTVLYDSENNAQEMENHAQREEIQEALQTGEGDSVRYSKTLTQKTIYRAKRLSDGTVLRVSVSIAAVWMLVLGMLPPIALVFAVALVLSIVLSYQLSAHIMRPLEQLDLDRPAEQQPYEELAPLLKKIEYQHRQIEAQKKELSDKYASMQFAEENRKEFTANVSHELRSPLQSIMGNAELIENGLVKAEDLPRFAGTIRKESTRLLALIEDIIHLSRLDENSPMEFSVISVPAVFREEMEALQPMADRLQVQVGMVGDSLTVFGVPQLVKEMAHNLLDNAIKYNRIGGKVTIRLTETDTKKILAVSDTGIGIPKEHQSRIFERFYRVDKSHSKATGGTGLGLSIVKHAVAYMNGELSVESEPGVGTTITVKFPK